MSDQQDWNVVDLSLGARMMREMITGEAIVPREMAESLAESLAERNRLVRILGGGRRQGKTVAVAAMRELRAWGFDERRRANDVTPQVLDASIVDAILELRDALNSDEGGAWRDYDAALAQAATICKLEVDARVMAAVNRTKEVLANGKVFADGGVIGHAGGFSISGEVVGPSTYRGKPMTPQMDAMLAPYRTLDGNLAHAIANAPAAIREQLDRMIATSSLEGITHVHINIKASENWQESEPLTLDKIREAVKRATLRPETRALPKPEGPEAGPAQCDEASARTGE